MHITHSKSLKYVHRSKNDPSLFKNVQKLANVTTQMYICVSYWTAFFLTSSAIRIPYLALNKVTPSKFCLNTWHETSTWWRESAIWKHGYMQTSFYTVMCVAHHTWIERQNCWRIYIAQCFLSFLPHALFSSYVKKSSPFQIVWLKKYIPRNMGCYTIKHPCLCAIWDLASVPCWHFDQAGEWRKLLV